SARVCRPGFINAVAIQFRVPFVAGALGSEQAHFIGGAFEYGCAARVCAGSSTNIRGRHVADARQRLWRVDRLSGKDFGARQQFLDTVSPVTLHALGKGVIVLEVLFKQLAGFGEACRRTTLAFLAELLLDVVGKLL